MGKSTISIAIFNCYVSSPEGSDADGNWWISSGFLGLRCPERSHQRFGVSGAALEVQPLFDPQSGGRCEASRHVDWGWLRRETSSMTITSGDQRYVACLSFCGAFYVSICMKLVYWNVSLGNIMPLILYITSGGWKTRPLSQNQAGDVCFMWRRCR